MKSGAKILLVGGILLILLFIVSGFKFDFSLPTPPPPPPGPEPEVLMKTDIVLNYPISPFHPSYPSIDSMSTTRVGEIQSTIKPSWFPWGGTLKLIISYPNGQQVMLRKNVWVEWGEVKTYTFYWQTKQSGTHSLNAELYDNSGNILQTASEDVYVPMR